MKVYLKEDHYPSDRRARPELSLPQLASPSPNLFYLESVAPEAPASQKKPFIDYLHLLFRRKLLLTTCMLVGFAVALIITLRETPMYRAQTTLEIRTLRTGAALVNAGNPDAQVAESGSELETQIRVLESDALAERVRARLRREHPNKVYQGNDVFSSLRQKLRLPQRQDNVRMSDVPRVDTTVTVLGGSRILQITCESWDPNLTADYANALTDEYLQYNLENLGESINRISKWLVKQVREARGQLEQSENQLQNYTREANLVYTGAEQEESAEHKKLRQLQEELARATANRMVKQAAYEVAQSNSVEAMPEVALNDRLSRLQSRLADLRREYGDLRRTYTDSYHKVVSVVAQIHETETMLESERRIILERISIEYQQAQNVEKMLVVAYRAQLPKASETARKGIQYGLMKWDVETNRRIYEELLQRVKAMGIGSTLQANNSIVLDRAALPRGPFRPVVGRDLSTGTGSGLLLGLLIVLVGEFANRRLNAPGEAAFHLGVPELGVIPSRESIDDGGSMLPDLLSITPRSVEDERVELVTWEDQPSVMAEAYRSALASILLAPSGGDRPQVILVTSPGRGEGKSSTVSNLGIALTEINQKVVLIDADLRKPTLHDIFEVANTWGLSDILRERTSLKDSPLAALARPTSIDNLFLLPSGPGTTSIASLFYSDRMLELITRLRRDFDVIIIDTPPVSSLSDARFLGRVADGTVLVVRAGVTARDAAIASRRRLSADGIPLLGTILNAWDGRAKSRYGDSYYYPYKSAPD
jgi:succinoglycan biosynthesis transport protein ExoP